MTWIMNDGGREASGYKGKAGDCAVRAVAIVTGKPYREVYEALFDLQQTASGHGRIAKRARDNPTPRSGVFRKYVHEFLNDLEYTWTPTMAIGSGCRVHLRSDELPSGRLIARLSKHYTAVVDGAIHDTYDCSRDGTRCVYGYWMKED